jgi:hypothetical protein
MGMFDYYVPVPALNCPDCGEPLSDWQGKGGSRLLVVWTQLDPIPAQDRFSSKEERLPDGELGIYTSCSKCKMWVDADCVVKNGIWMATEICR